MFREIHEVPRRPANERPANVTDATCRERPVRDLDDRATSPDGGPLVVGRIWPVRLLRCALPIETSEREIAPRNRARIGHPRQGGKVRRDSQLLENPHGVVRMEGPSRFRGSDPKVTRERGMAISET